MNPALALDEDSPLLPQHAAALNALADELRFPFVQLVERLVPPRKDDIDWWVSEIASRNTYTSALFADCCRTVLAARLAEKGLGEAGIVVRSPVLRRVLRRHFAAGSKRVRVAARQTWAGYAARCLVRYAVHGVEAVKLLLQRLGAQWTRPRRAPVYPPDMVLVDTFVFKDDLRSEGFRDRYYPGLASAAGADEKPKIVYLPTLCGRLIDTFRLIRKIRASEWPFLLKEDFLTWGDYAHALTLPWRALRFCPASATLLGIDVTPLFRATWLEHLFSGSSMMALLNHRFPRRLKERGVRMRLFIDWFENQNIDKGLNAGFRRHFPDVPSVGYQGFIVSKLYLCMYPTKAESAAGVLPGRVAVCGRGFVEERKEFFPDLDVVAAPAFRFGGVWQSRPERSPSSAFTILAALPLEEGWRDVFALVGETATRRLPPGARFWIKPHPAAGPARRWLARRSVPSTIAVVDGDFASLLGQADVLVSNTSSVCLEALALGLPVVIAGNRTSVTQNPIPSSVDPGGWKMCFTGDELAQALWGFHAESPVDRRSRRERGRAVRETFFDPITPESVRTFLNSSAR